MKIIYKYTGIFHHSKPLITFLLTCYIHFVLQCETEYNKKQNVIQTVWLNVSTFHFHLF